MIDGKRRSKSFTRKRDAQRWESEQTLEDWETPDVPEEILSIFSLANAYLAYSQEAHDGKVFARKKLAMKRLFQSKIKRKPIVHPDTPIANVKTSMVLEVMKTVKAEFGPGPANTLRKEVSAMWEWGLAIYKHGEPNPVNGTKKYAVDEKPAVVPSLDDFWKVYNVARLKDKLMLFTYLHTAGRKAELFRLTWHDIDFERGLIRLGHRKRSSGDLKYDWMDMSTDLADRLREHKQNAQSVFVFCQRNGQPYTSRGKLMRKLCERAGVEPAFGFHGIRHLVASMAISATDLKRTSDALRHASLGTTEIYIHKIQGKSSALKELFDPKHKDRSAGTLRSKITG